MGEPAKPPPSAWRTARRLFRWLRIALLLLVLALVGAAIYLNRVGLPGFLRERLLAELRAHGIELNCGRLRWAYYRGVLASDVTFGPPGGVVEQASLPVNSGSPGNAPAKMPVPRLQASAREIAILPDLDALRHGRLDIRQVSLSGAAFRFTLPVTNGPPLAIALTNLSTSFNLLPNGSVELSQFTARIGDVELSVSGTLAHANELSTLLRATNGAPPLGEPASPGEVLRDYLEVWRKIQFSAPPELRLQLIADAREWRRTRGLLTVKAPGAETPWGSLTNFQVTAHLEPARFQTTLPFGWVRLTADMARTRWATAHDVRLRFDCPPSDRATNTIAATADFSAHAADTRWGHAETARGSVRWTQSLTNPVPLQAQGELSFSGPETPWASAASVKLSGKFWQTFAPAPADWGWWTNAAPYGAEWRLEASGLSTQGVDAEYVECDGGWHPPALVITNLFAQLYGGTLSASARCGVTTRAVEAKVLADFDVFALRPQLPPSLSNWLERIHYEGRPDLFAQASATLPPWTNPPATFGADLVPTLVADGLFRTGPGSYLGMEVTAAQGRITYSNRMLGIPSLHAVRPEGTADLQHVAADRSGNVYWGIRSSIHPNVARPVLGEGPGKGLDQIVFSLPPAVELQLWLNGRKGGLQGLAGSVRATNAIVRGQPTVSVQTGVDYTNQVLRLFQTEVVFTNGLARADGLWLDIESMRLTLTNAFSDTDPAHILDAIGDPSLVRTLSDYRFDTPPTVHLNGVIPLRGGPGFDLRAQVAGGPFHWWRITSPEVRGEVHFLGDRLELRRMTGKFYDGDMQFNADFDLFPSGAAHYRFEVTATNALLHDMVRDLAQGANQLQGRLDLRLNVTNAWTTNLTTWEGDSSLALRDGFLWEQPAFSLLSGFINTLMPGLGSVRFRSGAATVAITNGVFYSKDMLLDSALLQLKIRGGVDMDRRVDAVVQAKPLQTVGVIGPLLNSLLWPVTKALEFRVTGTLQKPAVEPEHAPAKLLLLPLKPFQTLKSLFGGDKKEEPVYQPLEDLAPPVPEK